MSISKHSLIRAIYLYVFALVGLVLMVIGAVRFVDMGLKAFIFTKADQNRVLGPPIGPPIHIIMPIDEIKIITDEDFVSAIEKCQDKCELTDEQKQEMENWLIDYKEWQEYQEVEVSYVTRQRQRIASQSLAFILIGLPLYLYHWTVIKRDIKKAT